MKHKGIAATTVYKDNNIISRYLDYLLLVTLIGLLTISPFYRGLFFRENYLPTISIILLTSVILIIKQIINRDVFIKNFMDIAFLSLFLAYLISLPFGISKSGALDGVMKCFAAFMGYKIAFELAKNSRLKEVLLDGIVLSGMVTGIFSLLGSGGIIDIKGVFGWGERLNGLYQYPNSTASILGAIFILNVFLLMDKKNVLLRVAYFTSASIMMLTFLETRSRGAMLTLAAAWTFAFLLCKAKDKLGLILYTSASTSAGILFYSPIYTSIVDKHNFLALFAGFITVSVLAGAIVEIANKKLSYLEAKFINRLLLGSLFAFVAAAIIAFNMTTPLKLSGEHTQRNYEIYQVKPSTAYRLEFQAESLNAEAGNLNVIVNSVNRAKERSELYNNSLKVNGTSTGKLDFTTNDTTYFITLNFINGSPDKGVSVDNCILKSADSGVIIEKLKLDYRFIPADIAKKINEISLKTESSSERLVFVRDGIKMFKDHFLTGTGGGGWRVLYTKYQSYNYTSTEAHNYYLQTAIESGILGVIAMFGILICFLIIGVKLYLQGKGNHYMLIGLISMLFELLTHAALDFDFSMYAIFLVLISGMGWLSSAATQEDIISIKAARWRTAINLSVLTLSVVVAVFSITVYAGLLQGAKAASLMSTDSPKAKAMYESALESSVYNSALLMDYSQIMTIEVKQNKDTALIKQIYTNYKKVEEDEPYETRYYGIMMNFYMTYGFADDALALSERLIEVQPFKASSYETRADVCYVLIRYYFDKKDYRTALKYNGMILDIEKQYEEANKRLIAPFELSEKTREIIEASKTDKVNMEKLMQQ